MLVVVLVGVALFMLSEAVGGGDDDDLTRRACERLNDYRAELGQPTQDCPGGSSTGRLLALWLLLASVLIGVPIVVLYKLAERRGQSRAWAWLGLLGLLGLVIGLVALYAVLRDNAADFETAAAPVRSRQSETSWLLNELAALRDRGILTEAEFEQKKTDLLGRL